MKQFQIMVGLDKENAFEGWFSKIDDRKNDLMFSIIWGYSTHNKTKHAFIQFQNNIMHDSSYVSYSLDDLTWQKDPFILKIGKNELSKEGLLLDFESNGVSIKANLKFSTFDSIKHSFLKPNIMGLLSYIPNECNHAIISMHHEVSGDLQINDQSWEIQDADGYIEKDWGTGFPKEYVWVQANDWQNSSIVFSYATVPVLGKFAKGFFLMLHHEGKEYRFSSIEGTKLTDFSVTQDSFNATIKKKNVVVTLKAKQFNPVALAAPISGEMKSRIKESLDGTLELSLEIDNQPEVKLSSQRASIDVHFG